MDEAPAKAGMAMASSVSAGFAPWRVRPHWFRPHIDSSSDQVLQIYLSHTKKKDNIVRTMKRKDVYFSFFNPLKVIDKLETESLGWVCGGKLGGGKLAMGQNRYKPPVLLPVEFATHNFQFTAYFIYILYYPIKLNFAK